MTERPYTNARVSKDGRWHVVVDTPSVIATPDGAISIAWGGTDEKYRLRAEIVASEIVETMNRRSLPAADAGSPPTHAAQLAAALALPEVAAMVGAAKAIFSADGDYVKQVSDLGFALESLSALEARHD